MPRYNPGENPSLEGPESGDLETLRTINDALATRNVKQTELLNLLRQKQLSQQSRTKLWDFWLELQIAQTDLELLLKAEVQKRHNTR